MSEIILKGDKESLDLLVKKERIWFKRHGIEVVDKKQEPKKRNTNKQPYQTKLSNESNKK